MKYTHKFLIAFLTLFALPTLALAQTWVGPTATPPGNNASTPINVSATSQTKTGALIVSGGVSAASLSVTGGSSLTGNVGVGTTSPSSFKLQVAGNIGPDADFTTTAYNLGSASQRFSTVYGQTFSNGSNSVTLTSTGNNVILDPQTNTIFQTAGVEKARFASNGNLGIGTTNPTYPLDVNGDINYTGTLRLNGVPVTLGGSQWTTSGSDIYYTTGNVMIGNTVVNPASGFSNQKGFGFNSATGQFQAAANNVEAADLSRFNGTGQVLVFRYAATSMGDISTDGTNLSIDSNSSANLNLNPTNGGVTVGHNLTVGGAITTGGNAGIGGTLTANNLASNGSFTLASITGSTQCLQVNSSGLVSGTGSGCGAVSSVMVREILASHRRPARP